MQRPASAATVGDTGNEGIAPVRHNKLQTRFVSGHGSRKAFCVRSGFALLVRPRFSRVDFSARLCP